VLLGESNAGGGGSDRVAVGVDEASWALATAAVNPRWWGMAMREAHDSSGEMGGK